MNDEQQLQPIDPGAEIGIVLAAGEWNALLEMISKYSTMVAIVTGFTGQSPLISRIASQVRAKAAALGQQAPARPNGPDQAEMR